MLSEDFLRLAKSTLATLDELPNLMAILEELQRVNSQLLTLIAQVIRNNDKSGTSIGQLQQTYGGIREAIRPHRPKLVFGETEQLLKILVELNLNGADSAFKSLHGRVKIFDNAYQEYIDYYTLTAAVFLVHAGAELRFGLDGLKAGMQVAVNSLDDDIVAINDGAMEIVEIRLSTSHDLRDFSGKLVALGQIYAELVPLFGAKISDYPLSVIKIESGSIFIRLMGFKPAIKFLVSGVGRVAAFIYRNYTAEGRFDGIRLKADAFDELIKLSKSLEEGGIKVDGMKDEISKASVLLCQQFSDLLKGQKQIQVNASKFSLVEEEQPRKVIGIDSNKLSGPEDVG
jgi:hypothetical protein